MSAFPPPPDARASLRAAMARRDALEAEAAAIVSELETAPVTGGLPPGIKTSLLDSDGFPRADVDLYRTRELRQRLACVQTDHKALMKEIEALLALAFAPPAPGAAAGPASPAGGAPAAPVSAAPVAAAAPAPGAVSEGAPFATVAAVLADSPAQRAGLQRGDVVLKYGGVTQLDGVKDRTLQSVNEAINVVIRRELVPHEITLQLTPQAWKGAGLLGCVFVPL